MTVALSQDFLWAFSNIQKGHQKKVREFIEKFQAHPESSGIHYEPIQSARDKNFYSVRVDQAYRAIIARPDPSVYVLMCVDHHDEAYESDILKSPGNWSWGEENDLSRQTGVVGAGREDLG